MSEQNTVTPREVIVIVDCMSTIEFLKQSTTVSIIEKIAINPIRFYKSFDKYEYSKLGPHFGAIMIILRDYDLKKEEALRQNYNAIEKFINASKGQAIQLTYNPCGYHDENHFRQNLEHDICTFLTSFYHE